MFTDDRQFPAPLAAVAAVALDYDDGAGVDFEPYAAFLPAEETAEWFRAWTGNRELNGDAFRVFGQDGAGGYTAFWLARQNRALADQPIVFLGSEGETGVVARDLGGFLWLLADGFGPCEAVDPQEHGRAARPHQELAAIAEQFAPDQRQPAAAVTELATREFPDFENSIMQLCR
ncbi:SMI1/KNR4 family protein [Streptomyces sp. H27-D2]|uniref:SMI1/KNR4 family protein n=1 Tax=Streptomyces sp. H27-D2 TaxID=3046304 RepID=UPI002DB81EEC|nr:SMI1/KNR4 family protein [Streptomyces sp. H27-D2]MEC4016388.1 SMI1/KNR4 family protein [Streptomyces sp. H27-D2]